MIDVIIPAYNAHKTIGYTLSSIAFQDCVSNLNVYIINDKSIDDYSEFVDYYSNFMKITELKMKKNLGPGLARQYGIDNSNSDYLIFIDSDDVFSDSFAITRLYDAIVSDGSDISVSGFLEELDDGFKIHDISYIWMHSKMYRRSYLKKNNIFFNNSRANEDCGFNHLCYLCGAVYSEVDGVSYIWRNNKNSITRVNSGESFRKQTKSFTYNMLWSLDEAFKRKFDTERFSNIAYGTLVSTFHYFLQDQKIFYDDNILEQIAPLINYCEKFPLSDEMRKDIIKNQLMAEISGSDLIKVYDPQITLNEFILLLKKYLEKDEVKYL